MRSRRDDSGYGNGNGNGNYGNYGNYGNGYKSGFWSREMCWGLTGFHLLAIFLSTFMLPGGPIEVLLKLNNGFGWVI